MSRPPVDPDALDTYWTFVCERQNVYHRRFELGQDPPWTEDPILQTEHYTNMYRILDPGTQFVLDFILNKQAPRPDKLFNVFFYRLIASWEPTIKALGFMNLSSWTAEKFSKRLKEIREEQGRLFGGAYMVNGYHMFGGSKDKVDNITNIFRSIHTDFPDSWGQIERAKEASQVYDVILSFPGAGNFLAYQTFVDCTYPIKPYKYERGLLPFSQNNWAAAGPGAKRGIKILTTKKVDELRFMKWLWKNQVSEFERLDLDFPYYRNQTLSLPDIQNTLCEFSKYWRRKQGGKIGRKYTSA